MFGFRLKKISVIIAVVLGIVMIGAWVKNGGNFDFGSNDGTKFEISAIQNPQISKIEDGKIIPQPLRIVFSQNVAAAEMLDADIENGIKMYPSLRGKWRFTDASVLEFVPEKDWLPATQYKVSLGKNIFAKGISLKKKSFVFETPDFEGVVIGKEFYEDPQNRRNKSAVAEFLFSHPLDPDSVKSAITVKDIKGKGYDFTYKLAENNRRLYVLSAPLKIEQEGSFILIEVADVKNSYNDKLLHQKVIAKVNVPGIADFFNVKSVTTNIVVDKKNGRPQQVLDIQLSSLAEENKLPEYLQLYYSDKFCHELKRQLSAVNNDPKKIKELNLLDVVMIKQANQDNGHYQFSYNLEQRGKCLLAKINKGLSSVDGFMLATDVLEVLPEANYPLEAKIAYSGAVVPLRNNPHLKFVARGVQELQVKLARIESDDLNNLVTQTGGQFASPYFLNYNFNEYNMAQIFEKKIPLNMTHPADLNYASVDLKPYLGKQKGIFIVSLKGMYDKNNFTPEDRRLVIVTDLGLVVKNNLDKSHDIFVASLSSQKPVVGAKIEVLGKNGLSVVETKTDAQGHAKLPDLSGYEFEKQPVAYKVSLNGDVSYLPVGRYDLLVNYSRFAVDGIYVSEDKNYDLNAEVFSDRGIYRPGEDVHLGIILRQNNFEVPQHLPLEAEIVNPRGDVVSSGKLEVSASGLMEYAYKLPENANTGYYNMTLYRRGKDKNKIYVASGHFRVEEFEADSMKIALKFDATETKGWIETKDVGVKAYLTNLYGNPAIGHTIKTFYTLHPSSFYFEKYAGFVFTDPLKKEDNSAIKEQKEVLDDVITDETGKASINIDLSKYAQGTYRLTVHADGMEAGSGRGVSVQKSVLVSPNSYLVGYKANGSLNKISRNGKRQLELIAINSKLQKIEKNNLKLYLKQREYLSNLVEMPNGTYKYQVNPQEKILKEERFDLSEQGKNIELDTSNAGEFVIYLVDDNYTVAKINYTVDALENEVMALDKDANLVVELDKSEYATGEEIKMKIAAPYQGYGLVTIERDTVYAHKWFISDDKTAQVELRLPDGVEGNAYVNVAWFRSLNSEEIFRSPMSYAVVPFKINHEARKINPEIDVPQKIRPGEKLTIKYKTEAPAQVIIWGVNEGILQVADYKTPDPLAFFMKKRALRVVTAQIMDLIMPNIRMARFVKAEGGDMARENMMKSMATDAAMSHNPFARKLNKVTAFWSGVLEADEAEKEFDYVVPETFSGQMRIMAVAVNSKQFGKAEKDVLVRGDFVIKPSGPFFVTSEDDFVIGVGVANLVEGSGADYKIRVDAKVKNGGLELVGDAQQEIIVPEGEERVLSFKVKAKDVLGTGEVYFEARAVGDKTKKAGMPYYVGIRPATPYMTDLQMGYRKDKLKLKNFMVGMYPQQKSQVLNASTSPLVLAEGLLRYLDKFEHPCTEQTVSKVYPAMALMFKHSELVDSNEVYRKFEQALQVLTERQQFDGSFALWSNLRASAGAPVSLYATEFLVEARERGMNVPQNLLNKALSFARNIAAKSPENADDFYPAYATYILTRSGQVTTNYLLNLEKEMANQNPKEWKNSLSATYLAASYKILQNDKKAFEVLGKYEFGDDKLNNLRYLYIMASYFPQQFASSQKQNVEALLSPMEEGFYNTWNSAYAILAMNAFAGEEQDDSKIVFDGHEADYKLFAQLKLDEKDKTLLVISPQPFFYSLSQQGYPREKLTKSQSEGIEVSKEFLDKDGKPVTKVKLGEEFEVVIKLRALNNENIYDVAIVDLLPGGTDIIRQSLQSGSFINFSEEREDRMLAYMTVAPEGNIIRYKVKATGRGHFVVPPVYATAMYDIKVRAHGTTAALEIE